MKTFYIRSGELDAKQDAASPQKAAELALKQSSCSLGQQVFVNDKPIKDGKYNGETMFYTDALLTDIGQSFEEAADGGFRVVG